MRISSVSALLCSVLLAAPLSAQVFTDTFSYPDGPVIPGWTVRTGSWAVKSQRIVATSGSAWQYITKDGFNLKDSVMDGDFYFVGAGTQFAGLVSRHQGGTTDANLLMCKIQNNGGAADFDRCFIYQRPTPSVFVDIPGGTVSATCRFITLDGQCWMLIDANQDGVFELTLGPLAVSILTTGFVGMNGFSTSEMDNFKLYDAVLIGAPASTPKIGTNYQMQLRAPQPQGTPFLCAASLTATGIPIDTRKIPLSVDALLVMSISSPGLFNFFGLLDGNGDGAPSINIPNDPSLVGISMHIAGMTLVPSAPSGIGNISNNHYITIVP